MNVNQCRNALKLFFAAHAQIQTIKTGNQFNFNCMSNIVYPIAHIEYVRRTTINSERVLTFLITIADIFDPNLEDSEEDIYSDTEEIAEDCITYFGNLVDPGYTIQENVQVEKFNNGLKDKVCGSTFIFQFSEFREANACLIPLKTNINNG